MTTTNTMWQAVLQSTSDAAFRAWGQAFAQSFTTCGLIKTADTGQINWATVLVPTANTLRGYEIYRLNDALQATYPIFFRVDFGAGGAAATPGFRIQIGTGTDGAGAIAGVMWDSWNANYFSASYYATYTNTTVAQPLVCMASGDGEFVYFNWNAAGYVSNGCFFMFERSRDTAGNTTGDGFFVGLTGYASTLNLSKCATVAYGAPAKNAIWSLQWAATNMGLTLPSTVNGLGPHPGTPSSLNLYSPMFLKINVFIPNTGCSWSLRNFLMPPSHADATLAPTFRTDPDGKGVKLYKIVPLGAAGNGVIGYGSASSVPVAFTWAD